MSELSIFTYDDHEVHAIDVDGDPWFVAADVCAVLDIANVGNVLARLDDDEKSSIRLADGTTGNPNRAIVNEPGLYSLILRSDKPEAKPFKRWVTHEVLPQIRKTGEYASKPRSPLDVLRASIDQIEAAQEQAERAEKLALDAGVRLDALEGRHDWFSALAYCKFRGLPTHLAFTQRLGSRAAFLGRQTGGLEPNRVQHPHFGLVNQWPQWVWELAVEDIQEGLG